MTEQEASLYLKLTPRTLRNYRRKGTLPYREVKGKTRTVIEYDRADLDRLKEALQKRQRRSKKPGPPKAVARHRVTFGLPKAEYDEFVAEAQKYGLGVGEYARRLVREGLESRFQQEAEELRAELGKTNTELRRLRIEVASAFEVVLENIGISPEEAKRWTSENIR